MNLRVRSVTAGAVFVSAMLDAACLLTCGARGSASPELGRGGRLEAAAAAERRAVVEGGWYIYWRKP